MKELSREELQLMFNRVGWSSEGLIAVQKDNKCFHIRPDGTPAYKERYERVGDFVNGIAWVLKVEKWVRIKKDGTIVVIQ